MEAIDFNAYSVRSLRSKLDNKLVAYLAATGAWGAIAAREAHATVVSNSAVQPFGINEEVDIDFNGDGQTDFQIDHDRVNLSGTDVDYLQLDKNDASSAADPLPIDNENVFPDMGVGADFDQKYLTDGGMTGLDQGEYVAALDFGTTIGPTSTGVFEFQETADYHGEGGYRRANRLIDEDAGQIDAALGGFTTDPPPAPARFLGLGGDVKYLGVAVDLQDAGYPDNPFATANGPDLTDDPLNYWYGWIGIKITNEADATGQVVGYAYEDQLGVAISAGDLGPAPELIGDYNDDESVDAADYAMWRDNVGNLGSVLNNRDPDNMGVVGEADFDSWREHFGDVLGSGGGSGLGGVAVPEPTSLVMAIVGGVTLLGALIVRKWLGGSET